ncbi:MAG: molecular chaperone TorD family protein [Acidimicrobiia bacterium]
MTLVLGERNEVIEAAGRGVVYSLLAAGLGVPSPERWTLLTTRLLPAALVIQFPEPLDDLTAELSVRLPVDLATLRDEHMKLFPPITSSDAPGYETGYRGDGIFQQTALLADIAGFYLAHGLRAGGSERERLDHIVVELEFMAVLMRKAAVALTEGRSEDAAICLDTAALFLRDHLGCWAPAYGRRIEMISDAPWYRSLGVLLAEWVDSEVAATGVAPVEIVEEPLPFDPPDDGDCGPCGVPNAGIDT